MSIWDIPVLGGDEAPYDTVAARMSVLVHNQDIDGVFVHDTTKVGQETSFEDVLGNVRRYNHFHVTLPPTFVMKRLDIATYRGEQAMMAATFMRGLTTIRRDAVEQVLELINKTRCIVAKSTSRSWLCSSRRDDFHNLGMQEGKAYIWKNRNRSWPGFVTHPSARFSWHSAKTRNSTVPWPRMKRWSRRQTTSAQNRWSPSACWKTRRRRWKLKGLVEALERRHAVVTDFDINNLLFADRTSRVRLYRFRAR